METRINKFLILCIIIYCLKTSLAEISTSNNQFGLELYSALASKSAGDKDFVLSPFPLTKLFAALYAGTGGGDTGKEIRQSLHFPEGDDDSVSQVVRDYKRVVQDFSELEPLTNIQSTFIFNSSLNISMDFNSILKNDLNISQIITNILDFNQTLEKTLHWLQLPENLANETTQFFQEKLDPNATLTLVSKSFFSAAWLHPFHPTWTKPSPFYYDETHANQVEMMFTRATVPYAEIPELDCTAVALPYKTTATTESTLQINGTKTESENDFHRLELIILLPNRRTGLPDLERKLKSYPFSRIPQQFRDSKDMFLYIPKFNASSVLDLSDLVEELGMKSLTNPEKVDLSKMIENTTNAGMIKISHIFHLVQFSIHENGSGGEEEKKNGFKTRLPNFSIKYISPESFRANRAFIGFLYDQDKHIILNIFRKTS